MYIKNYVDFGQNTEVSSLKCGACQRSNANQSYSNRVSECKQQS